MPYPARPLPEGLPHPAFSVADAAAHDIDRNRLRRRDLSAPFRGVREVHESADLRELCRSYSTIMRPDAYFCGPTAAALWGIPLPRHLETDRRLHVGLPHGRRATRLTGTVGHHFVITAGELTSAGGLRLTTPARTWCDLAPYLTVEQLVSAGDHLLWRDAPLATLAEIADMVRRHPGRRGAGTRVAAVPKLSDGSAAPSETTLRLRFAAAGLPPVTPNHEVFGEHGTLIAVIDLAFVEYEVGVDHEGDHHRTDQRQWRRDLRRFGDLEDEGWSMLRSTADDLSHTDRLIASVRRRLIARGWSG